MNSNHNSIKKYCPVCKNDLVDMDNIYKCVCRYNICLECYQFAIYYENGNCNRCNVQIQKMRNIRNCKNQKQFMQNCRIIQRNLVYIIGLPQDLCIEDVLRKKEYLGQYGKITKIFINKSNSNYGVYATFSTDKEAFITILALEEFQLKDNIIIKASFGTTKFCQYFLNDQQCYNKDCLYQHSFEKQDDLFSIDDVQRGIKQHMHEQLGSFQKEIQNLKRNHVSQIKKSVFPTLLDVYQKYSIETVPVVQQQEIQQKNVQLQPKKNNKLKIIDTVAEVAENEEYFQYYDNHQNEQSQLDPNVILDQKILQICLSENFCSRTNSRYSFAQTNDESQDLNNSVMNFLDSLIDDMPQKLQNKRRYLSEDTQPNYNGIKNKATSLLFETQIL